MREAPWLAILLVVSALVSLASIAALNTARQAVFHPLESGVPSLGKAEVTRYEAVFDGFTLEERIAYHVREPGLSMVYRSFNTPLYYREAPSRGGGVIIVESVKCPQGFYWYVYDAGKSLNTDAPERVVDTLLAKLKRAKAWSEAGCYKPEGLTPGTEIELTITLRLVPPSVVSDREMRAYVFTLASYNEHLPYHNLTIRGANGTLVALLPPQGEAIPAAEIRIGRLGKEDGLDLAILTGAPAPSGARVERVGDVMDWLTGVSEQREKLAVQAFALIAAPLILAAASPLAILGLYLAAGRERLPEGAIPTGLPPETGEKPWEVAARYGTPGKLSKNLIAATLIDLYMRGHITVDMAGKVRVLKTEGLDTVERIIARSAEEPRGSGPRLREAARIVAETAGEAVDMRYRWVLIALIAASLVLPFAGGFLLSEKLNVLPPTALFLAMILPAIAYGAALLAPVHVLGRWKPGYRERAEAWRRFAQEVRRMPRAVVAGNPRIAPYAAAVSGVRTLKRILAELGLKATVVAALLAAAALVRRHYILHRARSSAGGGGGGFGGGGAGAR